MKFERKCGAKKERRKRGDVDLDGLMREEKRKHGEGKSLKGKKGGKQERSKGEKNK